MNEHLSFPWNTFRELQRATDTPVISHPRDEALTQVLDDLSAGAIPRDSEAMTRRYRSLATNRAKKFRSRHRVAAQVEHHDRQMHRRGDVFEEAAKRELAALALSGIDYDDRRLLAEIFIDGCTYDEASEMRSRPIGTLKARVSRLRTQIRADFEARGITAVLRAA